MDDLVSIIVPIYNPDEHFISLIDCLFRQTYKDIEYIFVNDGGDNGFISIIQSELKRFPSRTSFVKILQHHSNLGISTSRKTGVLASLGVYIQFADQDDILDYDMVERMHELINAADTDVAICDFSMSNIPVVPSENNSLYGVRQLDCRVAMASCLRGECEAILWNKMIKRQLFHDHDLFAPDGMIMFEDLHVMYRVFYYATSISVCDNKFYHWLINPTSGSHTYHKKIRSQASVLINAINRMESFFFENMITDSELLVGMAIHEKRIMFDLAVSGDVAFLKRNRHAFDRVNWRIIFSGNDYNWKSKLYMLSFRYRLYPLFYLMRFVISSRVS